MIVIVIAIAVAIATLFTLRPLCRQTRNYIRCDDSDFALPQFVHYGQDLRWHASLPCKAYSDYLELTLQTRLVYAPFGSACRFAGDALQTRVESIGEHSQRPVFSCRTMVEFQNATQK